MEENENRTFENNIWTLLVLSIWTSNCGGHVNVKVKVQHAAEVSIFFNLFYSEHIKNLSQ